MVRSGATGRGFGSAVAAVTAGIASASLVLPDRLRIDHRFPFVAAVAWRPQAAAATLAGALALLPWRRTRPAGAAAGAVALGGLATVAGRAARRPRCEPETAALTVLSANVLVGRADTGALAALITRERPDLVVLPEAGPDFRDKLVPLLGETGYRSWTSVAPGRPDAWGVTLLAARRAGDLHVRVGDGMRFAHLEATGGVLGVRWLHAVHTTAPMGRRQTADWCRELDLIARWTGGPVAPLVVGDLNATADHSRLRSALGRCRSAATGTGRGLAGTYPSSVPRGCGIQIDHVLVPRGSVTSRFETLDLPGTDHRAVLTTVHLPAS